MSRDILERIKALEAGKPILPEPIVCPAAELAGEIADWHLRNPKARIEPLAIGLPDAVEL